jgi:hypothetical protein
VNLHELRLLKLLVRLLLLLMVMISSFKQRG